VRDNARSQALAIASTVLAGLGIAGCGLGLGAPQNAGRSASVNLSLTTVPTVRSVTVSPVSATFGNCTGGLEKQNTHSTRDKLGFPNGHCLVGINPGFYPITITNTGIASAIDINGTSANPSDGGNQWSLCNLEGDGAARCTHHDGRLPGTDQYLVENFSAVGEQKAGISATPTCDVEFSAAGNCYALQNASQGEGIELIGPFFSSDTYTKWTMTITWTPVPG